MQSTTTETITFRAWVKKTNVMLEDVPVWNDSLIKLTHEDDGEFIEINWDIIYDVVTMQYINKQDKLGNDIYEDDIVMYSHKDLSRDIHMKVVRVGSAFLQTLPGNKPSIWDDWDEVVVIGNIHENPELNIY